MPDCRRTSSVAATLLSALLTALLLAHSAPAANSTWVYPGQGGFLIHRPADNGDRVPDFSAVGYRSGAVSLPDSAALVSPDRIVTVAPIAGDNYPRLQAAIDQVSAFAPNPQGFRGIVQLQAGQYSIAAAQYLTITTSGVILRGLGDGPSGTIIHAPGPSQRTLIHVGISRSWPSQYLYSMQPATSREIIDKFVPVGAAAFRIDDPVGLAPGDDIILHRRCNDAWIHEIGMDRIPPRPDDEVVQWTPDDYQIYLERTITRIEADRVFIDAPLPTSIDQRWGGARIARCSPIPQRIENVAIENLRGLSDYASTYDPDHAKSFIRFYNTRNAWVRNVTGVHFSYAIVHLGAFSRNITVANCSSLAPKGPLEGGWRYPFNISQAQLCLFQDCYSDDSRHDYVTGSRTHGPHVFYNSTAHLTHSEVGPHHRWASGLLFDNIDVSGNAAEIAAHNRGNYGTGHGWSGANCVFWNCQATAFQVQNPITAQNWVIGGIGTINDNYEKDYLNAPSANYDSHGQHVALPDPAQNPHASLYLAQLHQRTADPNRTFREYLVGDIDDYTFDGQPGDDAPADPAWQNAALDYAAARDFTLEHLDQQATNHVVPFTFRFRLDPDEKVVFATLAAAIRKTGGATRNDYLFLEEMTPTNRIPFDALNLAQELAIGQRAVLIYEFTPDTLLHLRDGLLNAAIAEDAALDWASLHIVTARHLPHDLTGDGIADNRDLDILARNWLAPDPRCDIAPPPGGDGIVNFLDYAVLAANWSTPDTAPPAPDPLDWHTLPHPLGPAAIEMAALTASDPSGVEYYFANLTDPHHDSGWQSSPVYTDRGLDSYTTYTYRVKARDRSAGQHETAFSPSADATTAVPVSTVFETFDSDPHARGWLDQSSASNFNYNPAGYLDAAVAPNAGLPDRFCFPLGQTFHKNREFWLEWDYQPLDTTSSIYQQVLVTSLYTPDADNTHNITAGQFGFLRAADGSPRHNRMDLWGYNTAGQGLNTLAILDVPAGVEYGRNYRASLHYWYDLPSATGQATLDVRRINPDGTAGQLVMHVPAATVIPAGTADRLLDAFGIANRTDKINLTGNNVLKIDNLYFSTIRPNPSPAAPSF